MEFGAVGFDGSSLMGSNNGFNLVSSDYETKQKCYGSGFLKHERPEFVDPDDWRAPKSAKKTDGFSSSFSNEVLHQSKCGPLRSTSGFLSDSQNMLSFSSPKSETYLARNNGPGFLDNSNYNNRSLESAAAAAAALPYFQHLTAATYNINAGLGCCSGGLNANGTSMYFMDGLKGGLFTPSQFLELEHQALIFKYIMANEPIPPHLLLPIRKALESAGFSAFSAGPFRPTSWGWSPFHLALSNNTDPEPGRCRRTDGKKWRCSRDAMPDQKYCERHMNRGRHRSRKPVEGQTNNGHPPTSAAAASATNTNNMNHLFTTSSSSSSHALPPGAGTSNSFDIVSQHSTNLHSVTNASPTASPFINRLLVSKQNSPAGLQDSARMSSSYLVSPTTISNLNPGENSPLVLNGQFPFHEQHHAVSSSDNNFGVPASDFFLNKCSSFSTNNDYYLGSTHDLSNQKPKPQPTGHSLCSSFKTQSNGGLWPELEPDQLDRDRTQLSISIPMAPSDYMSSTSSPINEKTSSLSPLRLSREQPDSIQMGLGSSSSRHVVFDEPSQKTATWVPLTSMGGPLGEVLNNSSSSTNGSFSGEYCKNSSPLNLLSKGWDVTCPQKIVASSPTGVLHKAALRSLSNSSAGSSPRAAENSKSTGLDGGGSLCSDVLGSSVVTLVQHSSSLPALQHS